MQPNKNTVSPPQSRAPRLSPRVLAYWLATSVMVYGLANQYIPSVFLGAVAYLSVFPWLSNLVVNGVFCASNQKTVDKKKPLVTLIAGFSECWGLNHSCQFPSGQWHAAGDSLTGWAIYLQGLRGLMIIIPSAAAVISIHRFIEPDFTISAGQDAVFISLLGMLIFISKPGRWLRMWYFASLGERYR